MFICICWLKTQSQPKIWELCFIKWKFLGLQAWERASQVTLRELLWRGRGRVWLYRNSQQRAGSLNIKSIFVNENQNLRLREGALFYIWEDERVIAHWNHSFHMHLSYLGPVSCICPVLTIGSGCNLIAARSQVLFSFLLALEGWNHWWLWHCCLLI